MLGRAEVDFHSAVARATTTVSAPQPGCSLSSHCPPAAACTGPAPRRIGATSAQFAAFVDAGSAWGARRPGRASTSAAPPPPPALQGRAGSRQVTVSAKKLRVAINGFGRIGRQFLRCWEGRANSNLEVVCVNDSGGVKQASHLLKYDSTMGTFDAEVKVRRAGAARWGGSGGAGSARQRGADKARTRAHVHGLRPASRRCRARCPTPSLSQTCPSPSPLPAGDRRGLLLHQRQGDQGGVVSRPHQAALEGHEHRPGEAPRPERTRSGMLPLLAVLGRKCRMPGQAAALPARQAVPGCARRRPTEPPVPCAAPAPSHPLNACAPLARR